MFLGMKIIRYFLFFSFSVSISCFADPLIQEIPSVKISPDTEAAIRPFTVGNATIIKAAQIKQMGAHNLTEILRHYAGLQVIDLYGDSSQVQLSMAGFGSNSLSNVRVLIDGIPINNPDMGALNLNRVNISQIDHIEIYDSSSSVLYGDGAVGGVINIITKSITISTKKISGTIGTEVGDQGRRGVSAQLNFTQKSWNYYFSGLKKQSTGFREHSDMNLGDYEAQVTHVDQQGKFSLHLQQVNTKEDYPGSLTAEQVQTDPAQVGSYQGDFNSIENILDIFMEKKINSHWLIDNRASNRYLRGYGNLVTNFNEKRVVQTLNPNLKGSYTLENGNLTAVTGIDLERDYYNISYNNQDDKRNLAAFYGQLNFPVFPQWQLITGFRYATAESEFIPSDNRSSLNDKAFVSTLGLSWNIEKNFRAYIQRAGSYRFPKLDEAATVPVSQPPLQAQTGVMYETGLDYKLSRLVSKIDLYELAIQHEIAFNPIPVPGSFFGTNTNLDPTLRRGLDLSEYFKVYESWQIGAEYAYVNGKFSTGVYSGNRIPLVAEQTFTADSTFSFNQHWSWYLASIFVGERYPGDDDSNQQAILPSTIVYNTNLNYRLQRWVFSLRLNNITNKMYVESAFANGDNSVAYYPAPGRNFLFSVNYEF